MDNLDNVKLQNFIDDIRDSDNDKYLILQQSREIVFALNLEISEKIIYGGIMFAKNGEDFGGIFPSKKHVSFEFSKGFELDDPKKLLEGKGKYRRHLKLKSISDIERKQLEFFVKQII